MNRERAVPRPSTTREFVSLDGRWRDSLPERQRPPRPRRAVRLRGRALSQPPDRGARPLFVDRCASTAIAERLGELRYLSLLNRFVGDASFAVAEAGGGIHKYVGDEVIATWHLAPGANPPACVGAVFAALDRIAAQGPAYQREFGVVPDFRAALHCGPVAVGELGSLRREIALIGDTMNTAARILEACRDTGNRVLASAALIERLATLAPGVTRRGLGELPVRGKEHGLELDVLEAWSLRQSTGAR